MRFDFYVVNEWDYLPSLSVCTIYKCETDNKYSSIHHLIDPEKFVLFYTTNGLGRVCADEYVYHCRPGDLVICRVNHLLSYKCSGEKWDFWLLEYKATKSLVEANRLYSIEPMEYLFLLLNRALASLTSKQTLLAASYVNVFLCEVAGVLQEHIYSEQNLLKKYIDYMTENISNFSLKEMSLVLNTSAKEIAKVFKEKFGETPYHYYQYLRAEKALPLLLNTTMEIEEIAAELGYCNAGHFSKIFKQFFNLTPQKYRSRFRHQF